MTDPIAATSFGLKIIEHIVRFFGWFRQVFSRKKPSVPHELTFTPQHHLWNPTVIGDMPAMQLMSDWWMMNATPTAVSILRAEVVYWHRCRRRKSNQQQSSGPWPIPPGELYELRLLFFVTPPAKKENKDLWAKIYVIDNFNRRHKAGKVKFISHKNPQFPS